MVYEIDEYKIVSLDNYNFQLTKTDKVLGHFGNLGSVLRYILKVELAKETTIKSAKQLLKKIEIVETKIFTTFQNIKPSNRTDYQGGGTVA